MAKPNEKLQQEISIELDKIKKLQKEYQVLQSQRQQLNGQAVENEIVQEEFNLLKKDAEVFKMIGSVLVKQDLYEAKQTVAKRIEYIKAESQRMEAAIEATENKLSESKENFGKLQQRLEKLTRSP